MGGGQSSSTICRAWVTNEHIQWTSIVVATTEADEAIATSDFLKFIGISKKK